MLVHSRADRGAAKQVSHLNSSHERKQNSSPARQLSESSRMTTGMDLDKRRRRRRSNNNNRNNWKSKPHLPSSSSLSPHSPLSTALLSLSAVLAICLLLSCFFWTNNEISSKNVWLITFKGSLEIYASFIRLEELSWVQF